MNFLTQNLKLMQSYPFTRTSMKPGYYRRIKSISLNKKEEPVPSSYFYIGKDPQKIEHLSTILQEGYFAEHFYSAKEMLQKVANDKDTVPDVIIIDIPFNESNLIEFNSFLRNSNQLSLVPVLYNKKHIINGYKDRVKKIKMVDDIIELDSFHYNLIDKVSFLRETKVYNREYENERTILQQSKAAYINSYLKRLLDIILASIALLILLPFLLIIALAIKIESNGSIFYTSYRAGRGFNIFKFYKFRTMEVGADQKLGDLAHLNQYNGSMFFKVNNDPRVTQVGAFLRKTSLDELPQFWNVLLGDMSLVGNRPLPLYEAAALTTNESVERFMAPAGMTGLWQIKKRGSKKMSTEERINLDIAYARRHNLAYDLWIIANTPSALLQKSNA